MAYWLAWEEPRAVGDLVHVEKFFARNLGGLTRARTRAGPAREGRSRTPSMYADEKSDEVVVPRKRSNKGRQLPAEVVEGRASPEGNSRQAAVVRTLSRATTAIRLAAVRWCACGFKLRAADVRPEGGARCVSSARRDLCRGRSVMSVPTATIRLRVAISKKCALSRRASPCCWASKTSVRSLRQAYLPRGVGGAPPQGSARRVASNRNHVRRSASSIQTSNKLAV